MKRLRALYLLHLTSPAPLTFMWPRRSKSHSPSVQGLFRHGIFQAVAAILNILLNRNRDCPTTIRRMLQVLLERIIVFLPAIQVTLTKVTCCIVRAGGCRLVEESSSRKLKVVKLQLQEKVCLSHT